MRLLLLLVALQLLVAAPDAGAADVAIVLREAAALRGEARDAKRQRAALSQGDMLEVRGERLDYLNVYDHRRERAGFVRASHVRRLALSADEAPELLALVRYLRDAPGSEGLGIPLVAAYVQAAPAARIPVGRRRRWRCASVACSLGAPGRRAVDIHVLGLHLRRDRQIDRALARDPGDVVAGRLHEELQDGLRLRGYDRLEIHRHVPCGAGERCSIAPALAATQTARRLVEADARARAHQHALGAAEEDEGARGRAGIARDRAEPGTPDRLPELDPVVEQPTRRLEQQPGAVAAGRAAALDDVAENG
jgi:hypothetical protein